MPPKELDTVVLNADIPAHDLKRGDFGAVVLALRKIDAA